MNTTLLQIVMLAVVASIHARLRPSTSEDVNGRDKPGYDGNVVFMGSGLRPAACPGMTAWSQSRYSPSPRAIAAASRPIRAVRRVSPARRARVARPVLISLARPGPLNTIAE